MTLKDNTPKVYCGTYAKYNNGSIAGAWIDLSDMADVDEFYKTIKELHKDEDDPEYMYQDTENIPEGMYSESGMDFEALIPYAQLLDDEREIVDAYIKATGDKLTEDILITASDSIAFRFNESYDSGYKSFAEQVGYEMADETGDVPERIAQYFDYEAYGESWLEDCAEADGYAFRSY